MSQSHFPGQRVSYNGAPCTVRYIGPVAGTEGDWLGVEWDDPARGKHDGSHKGERYFRCLSQSATAASFVRPTRPPDPPQSFLAALNDKYAGDPAQHPDAQIVISGKVAQEMGFDKIRRKQAQVADLKFVILDGMRVAAPATRPGEAAIRDACPSIAQLDLSRNLFQGVDTVVRICGELPALRKLSISGNRFQHVAEDNSLAGSEEAFKGLKELALEDTLLDWNELCHIASRCLSLASLNASANQLSTLPMLDYRSLSSTLTSLHLEYNDFTTLADLSSLASLTSLRNLHLKGNNINALAPPESEPPVFPPSLQYLDVSYNAIESWSFVDRLPTHLPGLTSLRLAHNPVYSGVESAAKAASSEEAHMLAIARLAPLRSLNFSQVKPADRANAEMFYLSRIARQLAAVPEAAEASVLARHPRWAELCAAYGAPDVIRRDEVNPAFLEARLVSVAFRRAGDEGAGGMARIPTSFDIYAVKGIAGDMFGLAPRRLGLVWETGEWDPVGGYEDREEDSSDEEEELEMGAEPAMEEQEGRPGRWVRREVELKDGPRQLGYCVDGLDVKIRVEAR